MRLQHAKHTGRQHYKHTYRQPRCACLLLTSFASLCACAQPPRYDARIAVEEALAARGLLGNKYPKPMALGFCSRSGDVIEPMIMPQWFVDCEDMARRSVEAVRTGKLNIRPAFHEKTWYQWLENIRPWCVSRQLWWGHRIPAYFATAKGEGEVDRNADKNKARWVVARSATAARSAAAKLLGVPEAQVRPTRLLILLCPRISRA